ncbi:MAG: Fur family transcriptional regulator [Chloroflexota bacterium]
MADERSEPLAAALARAGERITAPRRAVVELIEARSGHFTAADLVADARRHRLSVGRATIFRTLDLLTSLAVIERLDLPSGDHAYVGCERAHHHHVVCARCGRATDVDDSGLRGIVQDIARRTGYRIETHRLELFGLCPACQAAA